MSSGQTEEFKDRLISNVKKEVKQVMEEAVTRKYIHEESGSVTSLCAAVEACLSQGLRRRALGLFKTSSTTALLHKIGKHCPEAAVISQKVQDIENSDPNKRSSSSGDSTSKPPILKKNSSTNSVLSTANSTATAVVRYLWIRLALYEKKLTKIIDHLVSNAPRYYERDALVADVDYGSILSSLLVGPCALEYSKAKTNDHYYSDPPADELVQRHRISSGHPTPPTCRRPMFNFKRSLNASSEDGSCSGSFKSSSSVSVAKDYVESLHQNSRETLLYGKNNVLVLPKDVSEPLPGYLTLHQTAQMLTIKWTPNQLMNKNPEGEIVDKSVYWNYFVSINVDDIVYVHCHQAGGQDTGGTIILVEQDGVQRPPIHFPEGGHMAAFLSCLETGLLPHGQLDPPLWSQRGIGKLFPWPPKGRRRPLPSLLESVEEMPIDYVFRIVNKSNHKEFLATHPILELGRTSPRRSHLSSSSTNESSDCSSKSLSLDTVPPVSQANQSASIALVCSTMRRQIISRAFYGWLAYCRHLSTVRTHLSGLVNGRITPDSDTENGLTKEKWESLHCENGVVKDDVEVYRLVYFGGVQHEIRKDVWPYLLGHYSFGSTAAERNTVDETTRQCYEQKVGAWLAVEAIVRQLDKEKTAHAVAKLSSESGSEKHGKGVPDLDGIDGDIENDVFEENGFSDLSDPEDFDEEQATTENQHIENIIENNQTEKYFDKPTRLNKSSTDSGNVADEDNSSVKGGDDNLSLKLKDTTEIATTNTTTTTPITTTICELKTKSDNTLEIQITENCFAEPSESSEEGVTVAKSASPSIILVTGDELLTKTTEIKTINTPTPTEVISNISSPQTSSSYETVANDFGDFTTIDHPSTTTTNFGIDENNRTNDDIDFDIQSNVNHHASVIITNASIDIVNIPQANGEINNTTVGETDGSADALTPLQEETISLETLQEPKSACVSPASSGGGVYSCKLLDAFGLNLHRIEKDVQRCDRNYWYFANENLDKLRNVICTYVWEHLDIGYMQGMCDLVAPLLVIFDDESLSYGCFCRLMERMIENFPNGGAMDMHFANMRSLIQILDSEMYDLMHAHGDYTHFYFCYRWFLLDFKRELVYTDIFSTWECIWAAKHVASAHFVLFLALALLETYRDIILLNSMDFTDVIKFFNEMAERHNTSSVLKLSRSLVLQLQTIIENK